MTIIFANIFLACFIIGFILTAATFLFGMDHHSGDVSMGHGGDFSGDVSGGDLSVPDGGDASGGHHAGLPLLNFNTIALFLTWFGAVGYVLNSQARVGPLVALLGAIISGFLGALIILMFVNKFLMKGDTTMRAVDYYLPGTLAKVTSSIRQGGAGEIVYVQGGTRKTAGAKSDEDALHPYGQEVVIVRYEKGLAYVRAVDQDEPGMSPDTAAEA